MYCDLLVHVGAGPAGRARVRFAADLSERMGARLSGVRVTPPADVPPVYKPSVVPEVAAKIVAQLAQDARGAEAIFGEATSQLSNKASWFQSSGDVAAGICANARYADLVILGQDERQGSPEKHPFPIAHAVVLKCGRPLLVLPATIKSGNFRKAAIAWDGSRESVRALHDALPLLSLSHSVQVITVVDTDSEDDERDARNLLTHLRNHKINIAAEVLRVRTGNEHEALRNQIDEDHYDLLVMGAYSHPMWLEFIFGGGTPSMLSSSKIPVLVSH